MSSIVEITLQEILLTTNNFSKENLIATGGYGPVYRGKSEKHGMIAVKRLDRKNGQGDVEFRREIALLSEYKHENIVSLLGFCDENDEKILVYKLESNGSLDKHLNNKDLSWIQRLQICLDAARGLKYLHDDVGTQHRILHRDVKSANILLDENWNAKISDLGLSRIGPANMQTTLLISNACGTFGYIDPEYLLTGCLTQKSDVYSFGVVLFEVLCGRPTCVTAYKDERQFLTVLVRKQYGRQTLNKIIHVDIQNQIDATSLLTFSTIAYQCLKTGSERPTMNKVVQQLQKALHIQLEGSSPYYVYKGPGDYGDDDIDALNKIQRGDVAELLLNAGAEIDHPDKWGSTPLADAIHYKNHDAVKLLEKHGAKPLTTPMHVKKAREIPEYEIDPKELDFTNSFDIANGTFVVASWLGTQVAVKKLGDELFTDEGKVNALRDELELLQNIRHPNVVQFLGAVTESRPMMIVVEYLPKGDLRAYLKRKGALKPLTALIYAMDIARGMNCLHENKPEPIIHGHLDPSNLLRDDSEHLKVADFVVIELLKGANAAKHKKLMTFQDTTSGRYVAPEVFRNEAYDTKVDVFSFALILQEMIEGCQPFVNLNESDVSKMYVTKGRPPFNAPSKIYQDLEGLIEECWHENPAKRPPFRQIIDRLESVYNAKTAFDFKNYQVCRKVQPFGCFGLFRCAKGEDSDRSSHNHSSRI